MDRRGIRVGTTAGRWSSPCRCPIVPLHPVPSGTCPFGPSPTGIAGSRWSIDRGNSPCATTPPRPRQAPGNQRRHPTRRHQMPTCGSDSAIRHVETGDTHVGTPNEITVGRRGRRRADRSNRTAATLGRPSTRDLGGSTVLPYPFGSCSRNHHGPPPPSRGTPPGRAPGTDRPHPPLGTRAERSQGTTHRLASSGTPREPHPGATVTPEGGRYGTDPRGSLGDRWPP